MSGLIEQIIAGNWQDKETGQKFAVPVRQVVIEPGIAKNAHDLIKNLNIGSKFTVVSDKNTHDIMAGSIEKALVDANSVILPDGVEPDIANVNKVIAESELSDAIIAVGSGTINDICKYASYLAGNPYVVFGTAPSMNGYSSANSSITVDGHKKTLKAQLPTAVFLDLDILCAAPKRLIRSGLGDSLCRATSQADWLLSHLLLGTKYNKVPFDWLAEYEEDLFASGKGLVAGDKESIELLAKTLIISGFGMYICGGSYPASQGEHLIAHTMEVVFGSGLPKTYHGEQIGVATLTMAEIQERVLSGAPFRLKLPQEADLGQIKEFFGKEIGLHCAQEYKNKALTNQKVDEINQQIEQNWAFLVAQLQDVMATRPDLEKILVAVGAPINPEELGWNGKKYELAVSHAKYMRDRFTFLDI
ncbi:MAG: egsA [Rickettsiaceae bacterium]|jgi:glycerol-1-phosphate dehydrogenase [NAD(P)+]|nr:egsA [Rickettsiaceae bacterium]